MMIVEDEEEKQRLIKVVEYVEESTSRELLCKFPDNSAFDFDYSQSSIWSPLVPRAYKPASSLDMDTDMTPKRKLSYGFGLNKSALRRVTTNIRRNIATSAFNFSLNLMKNVKQKNKKKKGSDFSATPPSLKRTSTPSSTKGWTKVLKAASKQLKKKKKKKDPTVHVKLSSYLRDGNF
ncbi:hypothetical protein L1049_024402 [Liquidambar formosana]|uniref:Uncharacterized protein n=1 Tax=Liquidambar formosana TaxID=63359 RepID=A0AAP0S1G9_LIQFO